LRNCAGGSLAGFGLRILLRFATAVAALLAGQRAHKGSGTGDGRKALCLRNSARHLSASKGARPPRAPDHM
jgi:hypothetical protein